MSAAPLAVLNTGVVSAVGLSAPAACAAIRAKITNPGETRFVDGDGEWIVGCTVPLEEPWSGATKLSTMGAMAIDECLSGVPRREWPAVPLLLCVAEPSRPGRVEGLEDRLARNIGEQLGIRWSDQSAVIAQGRASIGVALQQARKLVYESNLPFVLIAGVDSLLTWPQLCVFERNDRLLTAGNSNGFIPGEGAGAVLVGRPAEKPQLVCTGIGFGVEKATIDSQEPLRADGLVQALRAALAEAECGLHDLDVRITDVSGEQYYFKEAALALGRVMRQRKEEFDIWHAAECTGEIGAAAGPVALAVADAACRKAYAPGPNILFHAGNDYGERTAAIFSYGTR
jgi:3-oxoacyl-[acyl-carrier-protein] synthase-1